VDVCRIGGGEGRKTDAARKNTFRKSDGKKRKTKGGAKCYGGPARGVWLLSLCTYVVVVATGAFWTLVIHTYVRTYVHAVF
jgi:hypothetical protein